MHPQVTSPFLQHFNRVPASLLCFVCGALAAFAMAPLYWWPLLFISLSGFYIALNHTPKAWARFRLGWWFGFGYFLIGIYWIGNALLVEGNPYWWAWPLAVAALPAFLSLFTALPALLTSYLPNLKTISGFTGFIALIFSFEWLRGHVLTGFPWNLFGYTWGGTLEVAQVASLHNIYLLSALTIIWASAGGYIVLNGIKARSSLILLGFVLISLIASWIFGHYKLQNTPDGLPEHAHFKVVQPNIAQSERWELDKMSQHFQTLLELSFPQSFESSGQPVYIVWPETAFLKTDLTKQHTLIHIQRMLQAYPDPAYLISGVLVYDDQAKQYTNSVALVNAAGEIENLYHKHHLVPFGEYMPFQEYLSLLPISGVSGFISGNGPQTIETSAGLRYSPLVCYEIIFPGFVMKKNTLMRPHVLINVTNDAWYGFSPGPYQHLNQARFRAIEEGAPLIRSANTGVSAIISSTGKPIFLLNLNEKGVIRTNDRL